MDKAERLNKIVGDTARDLLDEMSEASYGIEEFVLEYLGLEDWQLGEDTDGSDTLNESYWALVTVVQNMILIEALKRNQSFVGHPSKETIDGG